MWVAVFDRVQNLRNIGHNHLRGRTSSTPPERRLQLLHKLSVNGTNPREKCEVDEPDLVLSVDGPKDGNQTVAYDQSKNMSWPRPGKIEERGYHEEPGAAFCAQGGYLMRKHFTCSQGHHWE